MATPNTHTLYIKMKNESGSEVWRNVAPSVGSGNKRLNFNFDDLDNPSLFDQLGRKFARVQTEALALSDGGRVQYKVVSEDYMEGGDFSDVIVGTDAWTDTTDEKLVVSVTNGSKDGTAKLPRAASALGTGSSGTYVEAVTAYSNAVASSYLIGDDINTVSWTQTHLTGTKDTLVAQND